MNLLDPKPYARTQIPYIKYWVESKGNKFKYLDEVGKIALSSNLHIVLVSYFLGTLYGFTPELLGKMKRDMDFYKIDGVEGFEMPKEPLDE